MAVMGPGSTELVVAPRASSPAVSLYRGVGTAPNPDPSHLIPPSCGKSLLLPPPLVTWLSPAIPRLSQGPGLLGQRPSLLRREAAFAHTFWP